MPRIALIVSYDGSGFPGWQTQPGGAALQDRLQAALSFVADHPVATVCAGRTDAGVHATSQVVHFDSDARRPLSAWVRGVNAHLPAAIAVQHASAVSDTFHARFDARKRRYRYLLHSAPVRQPLLAGRAGWTWRPVDVHRMRTAAAHLAGTHDFSAFRSSECQAASPVRTLEPVSIERRGSLLVLEFIGNAFLHHMVRNLVGALLMVGDGRREPGWIAEVLQSRDRRLAAPTFDASGLYLSGVHYPEQPGLPSWPQDGLPMSAMPLAG